MPTTKPDSLAAALVELQKELPHGETIHEHPDFPRYRITSQGRIYSLMSGRFLKPGMMGRYRGVTIVNADGSLVHRYVHRLVLEATAGPCPSGMETRHLNGDGLDNRATNLAWGSPRENTADKVRHGTVAVGDRNPMAKLSWQEVREIRAMVAAGAKQMDAVRRYGVSPMTVSRIVRRETWVEVA